MRKTILGYDLGIASVGWALFEEDEKGNPKKIIDLGSFVFNQIEDSKSGKTENIERRTKRSMRRQRRRRVLRLEDGRALFKDYLNIDFFSLDFSSFPSPYQLKVKGLTEKLSNEELSIALYHYLKYRGFKSNRKNETGDEDAKKMKEYYARVKDSLQQGDNKQYISQYLLQQYDRRAKEYIELRSLQAGLKETRAETSDEQKLIANGAHIRNQGNDYTLTVTRDMYLDEIKALLDKQIELGSINEAFKNKFIQLFSRQRDFSDGPGAGPYKIEWKNRIKKCTFDDEDCAPKDSLSARRFILLSALCNLRYETEAGGKYKSLSPEQIVKAEEYAIRRKTTKYSQLFKQLNIPLPFRIKGLALSKKERKEIYKKVFQPDENGEFKTINSNDSLWEEFQNKCDEKLFDKTFFTNSDLVIYLLKNLKNSTEKQDQFDEIANILLISKTDDRIRNECKDRNYSADLTEIILNCPEANATINLSVNICKKIIPYLEEGYTYDAAMDKIGLNHSIKTRSSNGIKRLPPIDEALKEAGLTLKNPVVKHTLVQMIRITNAIIDRYGVPTDYVIELARELKQNFKGRQEIRNNQLENQEQNLALKAEMLEKFPLNFSGIRNIKKDDLLKYKLYKEQGGFSPYTNQPISSANLFNSNFYQIDHIIPYSRSFDDSMDNKVLVESKENQDKKDCTPYEYYHDLSKIQAFINAHRSLSRGKIDRLLAKNFDQGDFLSKDFEDTAYLSKLARDLIEFYLVDDDTHVRTVSGKITETLRQIWGIAGRTHSYIPNVSYESDYKFRPIEGYRLKSMEIENNGNARELKIIFNRPNAEKTLEVSLSPIKAKKQKPLSDQDAKHNRFLTYFMDNINAMKNKFLAKPGLGINELTELAKSSSNGSTEICDACEYVWGIRCLNEIMKDSNEKIRSNDLHHALDACVIACATRTNVIRITRFYQSHETGKPSETLEKENPLPYPFFNKEVLARVYERDEDKLLHILNQLPMYKDEPATKENVHVLWPTRLPKKVEKGPISQETIYGLEKDGKLTKTISVDKLDKKNVRYIYNPNGGNGAVIKAIEKWLDNKTTPYPVLDKKGVPIKKVKIVQADSADGKVNLSNNRYAENSDCVRVAIYRSKDINDDRLYFVPIFQSQISQKSINKNVTYSLDWGQGNCNLFVSESELETKYTLQALMNRYTLIEIEKKDGTKGLAYSGGETGGCFEVYSVLGDNEDLIHDKLFPSSNERMRLTVSTIKSIKIRNVSVLGKIN